MVSVPGHASGGCRADRAAAAGRGRVRGRVRPGSSCPAGQEVRSPHGLPYPPGARVSVTVTVTVTVGRGAPASPWVGGLGVLVRVGSGALQSPRT